MYMCRKSEQVLDDDTIKKNIRYLQGRLLSDSSSLSLVESYVLIPSLNEHVIWSSHSQTRSKINAIAGKVLVLYDIIGTEIQLNVLIKDNLDIHRYYHLKKTQIPLQWSEQASSTLPEFVELLLNLRCKVVQPKIDFTNISYNWKHNIEPYSSNLKDAFYESETRSLWEARSDIALQSSSLTVTESNYQALMAGPNLCKDKKGPLLV
ncbi:hypothetical protein G9A89_004922 [Geosiphon pyriformis]|nr:hypothetical protein G9A89_004922 [Geosiphon pyriformis]